jgi:hypothetical protein
MFKKLRSRMEQGGDHTKLADPDQESRGAQGTQETVVELVPVQAVYENMMVLKDGSFRMILKTGAVNLDLKSAREQMLLLNTFGELLNSLPLDSPIQVLLHSAHLDIKRYTRRYQNRLQDSFLSPQMRRVIQDHLDYFEHQARANYLLDRSFYVIISFFGSGKSAALADGGIGSDLPGGGMLSSLFDGSEREKVHKPSSRDLELARIELMNRANLIAGQLSRLGIHTEALDEVEIVGLLRELYNPGISERQKLTNLDDFGSLLASHSGRSRQREKFAFETGSLEQSEYTNAGYNENGGSYVQ